MMDEKSKSKFFPVIFGVMGLTLLVLAWTIPTDTSDRITAAVIGSAGLFGAILRSANTGPLQDRNKRSLPSKLTVNPEWIGWLYRSKPLQGALLVSIIKARFQIWYNFCV